MPPELLREVLIRIESSENKWPERKSVVACATVCRTWREIMKEIIIRPEISGILTFPIPVKQDKFTPVMVRNADGSISTLSNCLHSLVGNSQTLQLDSCIYYDYGPFESFNCKNVLLDGDNCKPFGSSTPHSLPTKDKGVVPILTPVKRIEAIVRPAYADSVSEETVDSDPHESRLVIGLGMTVARVS